MNLVDAEITQILNEPQYSEKYKFWYMPVSVHSWEVDSDTTIVRKTEKEIRGIKIGDIVQI